MQIADKNVLVTVMLCILVNRRLLITACVPSPYNVHSHRGTEKNHPCPKATRISQRNGTVENEVVRLRGREHGRSLGKGRPRKPESQKRGSEKLELCATCLCISISGYPLSPWSCRWWTLTSFGQQAGNPGYKRSCRGGWAWGFPAQRSFHIIHVTSSILISQTL